MRHFGIAALAAVSLSLSACGQEGREPGASAEQEPGVSVDGAWVRLPPIPERPGAGYFTVEATGAPARLTAVESAAADRVELHETRREGDRSSMVQVGSVEIAAGESHAFEPGGHHLMLFGLDPALKPGATIPLTLRFAGHPPVTVEAELRAAGDAVHKAH